MAKNDRYRLNSNYGWKIQQQMRGLGYEWDNDLGNWAQIQQQQMRGLPQPGQYRPGPQPDIYNKSIFLDVAATPSGPRGSVLSPTYVPSYWEQPMKVGEWYTKWKADPTTKLPEGLDGNTLEGIYKYMEWANKGKPYYGWAYLNEADPFRQYLTGLKPPADLDPGERALYGLPEAPAFANIQDVMEGKAAWGDMDPEERKRILTDPSFYESGTISKYGTMAQQEIINDPNFDWGRLPAWQRVYHGILSSPWIMNSPMALAGFHVGKAAGPIGGVLGAAGGYALGMIGGQEYDPTKGITEQPSWAASAMAALNRLSENAEKAMGYTAQLTDATLAGLQGNEQAMKAAQEMITDPLKRKAAWEAGQLTYEVSDFGGTLGAKNWPAFLFTDFRDLFSGKGEYAGPGQDWMIGAAHPVLRRDAVWGHDPIAGDRYIVDFQGALQDARKKIYTALANGEDADPIVREMLMDAAQYVGGQLNDFTLQSVIDPLEKLPGVINRVSEVTARAAGNTVAAEAFRNTGTPREAVQLYRTLLQTGNYPETFKLDSMSWLSRQLAGITPEGKIQRGFLSKTDLLSKAPTRNFIEELTSLDPSSRAVAGANLFYENLSAFVQLFDNPRDVISRLTQMAKQDPQGWADLSAKFLKSPEFYTVLPALKNFNFKTLEGFAGVWDATEGNRTLLTQLAGILGQEPGKLLDDLAERGTAAQDFARITERLRASTDPVAMALLGEIEAGRFTADSLADIVKVFTGDSSAPWHPNQWKAQMLDALGTHFDEWTVKQLGIRPDSGFFRTAHLLKSVQSALLLGMSPGYALTNGMSNMVHRAVTGIYGYMTPGQKTKWLDRFGLTPARLEEGVGIAGEVQASARSKVHTEKITEARRAQRGGLTRAQDVMSKVNRGAPFSRFSAWFEKTEGSNGFMIAMRQFWGQTWRRGVGFSRMPDELAGALTAAGIDPEQVHAAIEAGMNQHEVERAVLGRQQGLKARSLLHAAAQATGRSAAESAAMLEQLGVLDALDAQLAGAKNADQVRAAFKRVARRAQDEIDMSTSRDAIARAEHVAQRLELEGSKALADIVTDIEMQGIEKWLQHYERMGEVAAALDNADPAQRGPIWEQAYRQSNDEFRRYNALKASTYLGVLKAIGLDGNPHGQAWMAALADTDAALDGAYQRMRDLRNQHFEKWREDWDNPRQASERTKLEKAIDDAFKKALGRETANIKKMADLLGKQYEALFGEAAGEAARQAWEEIADFRQEMIKRQQDFRALQARAREGGVPYAERQRAAQEFWGQTYKYMIVEMARIKQDAIARLDRIARQGPGEAQPAHPAPQGPAPQGQPPTPPPAARPAEAQPGPVTQKAHAFLSTLGDVPPEKVTRRLINVANENGIPLPEGRDARAAQQIIDQLKQKRDAYATEQDLLKRQAEERRQAELAAVKSIWDIAEAYNFNTTQTYSRGVLQHKFALLGALKKAEYGGDPTIVTMADAARRFTPEEITEILTRRQEIKQQIWGEAEAELQARREALGAQAEAPTPETPPAPPKRRRVRSDDFLGILIDMGGLNKDLAREIMGQKSGARPGLFRTRRGIHTTQGHPTGLGLDEMAVRLREIGYDIPEGLAETDVVIDMVKRAMAGEKIRSHLDDVDREVDALVKREAARLETQPEEQAAIKQGAEEVQRAVADDWATEFEKAAEAGDFDAMAELMGEMGDTLSGMLHKSGEALGDWASRVWDETSERVSRDQQRGAIAEATQRAQYALDQQQAAGEMAMTRQLFREKLVDVFRLKNDMADAVLEITDARAQASGDAPGWYASRIADVQAGGDTGASIFQGKRRGALPDDPELIVTHNLSADGLIFADELGGLAMPSIAITRKNLGLEGFGEITLMGDSRLIDPGQGRKKIVVGDADLHTPNQPRPVYQTSSKKVDAIIRDILPQMEKDYPGIEPDGMWRNGWHLQDMIKSEFSARGVELSPVIAYKFLKEKGYPLPALDDVRYANAIRDHVMQTYKKEYSSYARRLLKEITEKRKLFKGFDNEGNRRYREYNLENVVRFMKAQMGMGVDFFVGAGNVRAQAARRFRSLEQIRTERGRLTTDESMKPVKDEFNHRLAELAEAALDHYKGGQENEFMVGDYFGQALAEGIQKGNIPGILKEWQFDPAKMDMQAIYKFVDDLRKAPTHYFEAKPQRAVGIDEFTVAIVPKNLDADARTILERRGLRLVEYDQSVRGDRQKVVQQAAEADQSLLFQRLEPINRALTREEISSYARALVRAGREELRRAITNEPSKEARRAILDAAHQLDPKMAEEVAQQTAHMLFQDDEAGPIWYSKLAESIQALKQDVLTVDQLRGMINKGGIKAEELYWSGFDEWLKSQTGKVTKADALDAMRMMKVEDVLLGEAADDTLESARFHFGETETQEPDMDYIRERVNDDLEGWRERYVEEFGEDEEFAPSDRDVIDWAEQQEVDNYYQDSDSPQSQTVTVDVGDESYTFSVDYAYGDTTIYDVETANDIRVSGNDIEGAIREYLSEKLNQQANVAARQRPDADQIMGATRWGPNSSNDIRLPGGEPGSYRELLLTLPELPGPTYVSPHWNERNTLVHIRFDERIDEAGKRVIFIQELQSDWHQQGRERGYLGDTPPTIEGRGARAWYEYAYNFEINAGGWGGDDQGVPTQRVMDTPDFQQWRQAKLNVATLLGLGIEPEVHVNLDADGVLGHVWVEGYGRTMKVSEVKVHPTLDYRSLPYVGRTVADAIRDGKKVEVHQAELPEWADPDYKLWYVTIDGVMDRQRGNLTADPTLDLQEWRDYYAGTTSQWVAHNTRASKTFDTKDEAVAWASRFVEYRGLDAIHHTDRPISNAVPSAPFQKTWPELAMKRMVRYAAENGYDRVTFATGPLAAQIEGHSIAHYEKLRWKKSTGEIEATNRNWRDYPTHMTMDREHTLADYIGADPAKQMEAMTPDADGWVELATQDIVYGGEKMRWFYDRNLINSTNNVLKKWGVKVGDGQLVGASRTELARTDVHAFEITPAMRDSVMREGQPLFQGAKGAVTFMEDGRAIIHALQAADVSTVVHELGHIFRRDLAHADYNGGPQDLKTVEKWAGVKDGQWTTEAEEKFARAFEKYLADGEAPTPALEGAFAKFKNWLLTIYRAITGSSIDVKITPDVKAVFDRLLGAEPQGLEQMDMFGRQEGKQPAQIGMDEFADNGTTGGLLPGMRAVTGQLFDVQPGGATLHKMDAPAARSIWTLDPTRTAKDANGIDLKAGDMVQDVEGKRHTVSGANLKGQVVTTEGQVLRGDKVHRVARQDTFFQGKSAAELADAEGVYGHPGGKIEDPVLLDARRKAVEYIEQLPMAFEEGKGRPGPGGKGRVLASNVIKEFRDKGHALLVGRKVKNVSELANLAQVYRNPYFETFRWIFMKGNTVVGEMGVSAQMPGRTGIFPDGMDFADIKQAMDSLGADGYYMSHNHPSQDPNPSQDDIDTTAIAIANLPGFRGHVVIDHGKYAVLQGKRGFFGGRPHVDVSFGSDPSLAEGTYNRNDPQQVEKMHPVMFRDIGGPSDVVRLAAQVERGPGHVTLFALDPRNKVRGVLDVTAGEMFDRNASRAAARILRFAKDVGANNVIAVMDRYIYDSYEMLMVRAAQQNVLMEAIGLREDGSYISLRTAHAEARPKGAIMGKEKLKMRYVGEDAVPFPLEDADPQMPLGAGDDATGFQPMGDALDEGWQQHVMPLLGAMEGEALNQLGQRPLDGAMRDVSPEGQAMMRKYLKQVQNEMSTNKMSTMRWGEQQRDFALLNYNRRYGFDKWLDVGVPYQFFYTRSLINWAIRGLDRPTWFSNYARLRMLQQKNKNNLPERLRGKFKIPAPWLPEWMGDSLYIDPFSNLFTPTNFVRPLQQMERDRNSQQVEAGRILQEWAQDQTVNQAELQQAVQTQSGPVWERALAEAKIRREGEIQNPLDFMSMMLGPAWYLTTPWKLLKGEGKEIPQLPLTRTANAAQAVTQGTWAEPIGEAIGLLGKPEEWARKQLKLPSLGEYGEYYTKRQLANMVADGLLTAEEAEKVMLEKTGPAWEEATQRVQMELAMRVPLAGLTYNAVRGDVKGAMQAALPGLFGSGLLPAGELKYRGLKGEWDAAWKLYDAGNTKAVTEFFDEHPEYEAYLAKGKDDKDLLRSFLVGQIWDAYMELGKTDQKQARADMGQVFQDAFLNKETRSYDTIETAQLVAWARMLKGTVPQTPDTAAALQQEQAPLEFMPPEVTGITDRFFNERAENFPDYFSLQSTYYNLPRSERSKFLLRFPQLREYWKWKEAWYDKYPDLKPIFNGDAFDRIDTTGWSPMLVDMVQYYALTGDRLPDGAYSLMRLEWVKQGQPLGDFQAWLESVVAPAMRNQMIGGFPQ